MAPSYVKVSGSWKEIVEVYEKMGGVWTAVDAINIKVSGLYKEVFSAGGIDPNLLIMFLSHLSDRPADGILESGYLGRFPLGTTVSGDAGVTGGVSTHNHSAVSDATSVNTHPYLRSGSGGPAGSTPTSHSHTLASHTHPTSVSNNPSRVGALPYSGCSRLYKGAVIFGDTILPGCTEISSSYLNRYLTFENLSSLPSNPSSHNHGTKSMNTSTFTAPSQTGDDTYSGSNMTTPKTHYHSANHTNGAVLPYPIAVNQKLFSVDADIKEFPLGGRTFLKPGGVIPEGFSIYSINTGRLFRISSVSGGAYGTSTHSHTDASNTSVYSYPHWYRGSTSGRIGMYSHSHSFSHTHAAYSNTPLYRKYLCVEKTE